MRQVSFVEKTNAIIAPARADSLPGAALDAEPKPSRTLAAEHLRDVAFVLADFVDLKSTFIAPSGSCRAVPA
jgi:hypothetical protein